MNILHTIKNMGIKYVVFRAWYEFKKKTGVLKLGYPKQYKVKYSIDLQKWKENAKPFFFSSKEDLPVFEISPEGKLKLKQEVERIKSGKLTFFACFSRSR